eukprot:CAMPEP_0202829598 /NCGR_PEP_ID=MMETSP1389-20130828/15617_1 /ASSEMBLY_ACC=CAM_ASM_000865 /TAXON_ID=302021 /ORGANISM="Rhodomonas sp., Strain CCMP768" /LENGTH=57 /DNA_ID=CAMNT_0049503167 /DNA_START=41 /DNA_END=211 /DNA_ORIENTATION=+
MNPYLIAAPTVTWCSDASISGEGVHISSEASRLARGPWSDTSDSQTPPPASQAENLC